MYILHQARGTASVWLLKNVTFTMATESPSPAPTPHLCLCVGLPLALVCARSALCGILTLCGCYTFDCSCHDVRVHVLAPGKLTLRLCLGHFKRGSQILSGGPDTPAAALSLGPTAVRVRSVAPNPKTNAPGVMRSVSVGSVGTGLVEGILA